MTGVHRAMGDHARTIAGVALVAAYAALASGTHPFTDGADIVTALPLAAAVVAVAVRMRAGPGRDRTVGPNGPDAAPNRLALVWAAVALVIAGWELFCYLAGPRAAHPTLSSLLDTLDAGHGGRALCFALWLGLGWVVAVR